MDERDERVVVVLDDGPSRDHVPSQGHVPSRGEVRMAIPRPTRHAAGCACCRGRDPLAVALTQIFLERARGQRPWFDRVVLELETPEDVPRVAAVLLADPVMHARFRSDLPREA